MDVKSERRSSTLDRLRPAQSYTHPVTFHYEIQNHTTRMQRLTKAFAVYRLMATTLICVVAGLVVGLICRPYALNWTERQFMYIELPGELYLRFLKLLIIPLLVSNVILSFGTLQGKLASHLGKVASFLYLASNVAAITIAIVMAILVAPGKHKAISEYNLSSNNKQMANHHQFVQYHDSITRYREYHPMFYHTDKSGDAELSVAQQSPAKLDGLIGERGGGEQTKSTSRRLQSRHHLVAGSEHATLSQINHIGLSTKLPIDVVLDVLRNLFPDSLIGATMQQTRTRLFAPKELILEKNGSTDPMPHNWPMGHEMIPQANIIGLLAMSVLTGLVLSHMAEAGKPLLELCACISELSLRIGMKAINLAPVCIMFLLIGQVARARNLSSMAGELFMYSATVIAALIIHGCIVLPLIYYCLTKKSPVAFFWGMLEALVAAFATSSSSATMALVLSCLSELEFNPVIVRAFGPLGSVFNMNGTAIYETIAVIFIAQALGVTLPLTSLLLVGLSSAVASLSTSGIPSSGMMTMVIVLNAINLPVLQLSLIYIVDFIIDRFRTVVNVWSGAIVCGIIDHICPEHLFAEEMKPDRYREMLKYRGSRASLSNRKSLSGSVGLEGQQAKPKVISVTITPPSDLESGAGPQQQQQQPGEAANGDCSISISRV